ncbi:MAG: MAPEG family protein [Proteobacteria bacterium]|nr:MAPEG family protein [Pseudomonadota bacterium]
MSASLTCLIGLIAWTIILLFVLLGARSKYFFGGQLIFDQQGADIGGTTQRITRAQANSLEWLTIPAALLVYGIATGQSAVTDGLAMVVLGARVLQSSVHIMSVSLPAIGIRATLFTVQVVIWMIWAYSFYTAGIPA